MDDLLPTAAPLDFFGSTCLRPPYNALLVDPAWHWLSWSLTRQNRAAWNHYSVMSLADIKAMPVASLAARDCVLYLWCPGSMLEQGLDVIKAWGFTFKKVGHVWVKCALHDPAKFPFGTGYWTRDNPEFCLLATRGHPKRIDKGVPQLIVAPRREHSRKPDEIYERIERLLGRDVRRVELFARHRRPGWDAWGDEIGS
jgi:N6-adenosine-specific RNA methylase IME4